MLFNTKLLSTDETATATDLAVDEFWLMSHLNTSGTHLELIRVKAVCKDTCFPITTAYFRLTLIEVTLQSECGAIFEGTGSVASGAFITINSIEYIGVEFAHHRTGRSGWELPQLYYQYLE